MLRQHNLNRIVGGYIDDLCTGGLSHEESIARLQQLFEALDAMNFKIAADNIFLGLNGIHFLGYILD